MFKHPKFFIVAGILVGVLIGYQACNRTGTKPEQQQLTPQEKKAPIVQLAPYILQTTSRVYYVVKYDKVSEDKIILFKWYEWQKNDWISQYSQEGVPFDKQVQGDFRFIKR